MVKEEVVAEEVKEEDISSVGIGEKKVKTYLKPDVVKVLSYKIETRQGNDCLVVSVQHKGNKEPINMSGIKLKRFNKLREQGLWVGLDEDKKLPHDSGLAELLRRAKVDCIKDLVGKDLETDIVSIDNPILVFKGY